MLSILCLLLAVMFLKTVPNNWVSLSTDIWENARLTLVHEWKKSHIEAYGLFTFSQLLATSKTAAEWFVPALQRFSLFVQRGHISLCELTIIHSTTMCIKE